MVYNQLQIYYSNQTLDRGKQSQNKEFKEVKCILGEVFGAPLSCPSSSSSSSGECEVGGEEYKRLLFSHDLCLTPSVLDLCASDQL